VTIRGADPVAFDRVAAVRVVGIEFRGLLLGSLLLLGPGLAWAEPPPRGEPEAQAAPESAATLTPPVGRSSTEAQSLALRQQANAAYLEGRYEDALPLLEHANALAPYALHSFNLAAVQHRLGRCELARDLFERYLNEDPGGPARADAELALEELFARCGHAPPGERPAAPSLAARSLAAGERRGVAEPVVPPLHSDASSSLGGAGAGRAAEWRPVTAAALLRAPAVMAEPGPSALRVAGWSTLAAGGAAAVVAAASAILVRRAESDLEAMARGRERAWNAGEARALEANGERYQALALASGFGSALLLGTGVGLLLLDARSDGVSVSVSGDGALVYSRRF
jgi:tetratricopeptide (TPR) repeat protein